MHRRPQLLRQAGHRVPQLGSALVQRPGQVRDVLQGQHWPPQAEAVQVGAAVQGGPDEPRFQVLPVPFLGFLAQQLQKYVLIDVLRVGGVLHPAQGQPVHRVTVGLHGIAQEVVLLAHAMPPFGSIKSAFTLNTPVEGEMFPLPKKIPPGPRRDTKRYQTLKRK